MAVKDGATEIDIVINRTLALTGQWAGVCNQGTTRMIDTVPTEKILLSHFFWILI